MNNSNQSQQLSKETFICSKCGIPILKMNQVTHEARCKGPQTSSPNNIVNPNNNRTNVSAFNSNLPNRNPLASTNSGSLNNRTSLNNSNGNNINPTNNRNIDSTNNTNKNPRIPVDDFRTQPNTNNSHSAEIVMCPNCNKNVEKNGLYDHQKYDCDTQKIPCEFCQTPIPFEFYTTHIESCNRNPEHLNTSNPEAVLIPCENCGKTLNARAFEEHLGQCTLNQRNRQPQQLSGYEMNEEGGEDTLVACQYCNNYIPYSTYDDHIAEHQNGTNRGRSSRATQQQQQQQQMMMNDPFASIFGGNSPFENVMSQMNNLFSNRLGSNINMNMMSMGAPGTFSSMSMRGPGTNAQGQNVSTATRQSTTNGVTTIEEITTDANGNIQRIVRQIPVGGDGGSDINAGGTTMINFGGGLPMMFPFGGGAMMMGQNNFGLEQLLQQLVPQERGLDQEILQGLSTAKFDKEKSKNLAEDLKRCSICLTDFEDKEDLKFLPCTHRFHIGCIDPWLERHTTCPVCKKDFGALNH